MNGDKDYCSAKIVDMPMGSGKTNGIIEYMNNNPKKKYMFITPFLTEISRIKNGCPRLNFKSPNDKFSKLSSIKYLISSNENIASTHSLFGNMDDEAIRLLKNKEYTLVLDEVIDAIDPMELKKRDIEIMLDADVFRIVDDDRVIFIEKNYREKKMKFTIEGSEINNKPCYILDGSCIITTFNQEIFYCFDDIILLTYMFDGSLMRYYFEMNEVEYKYYYIEEGEIKEGKYDDTEFINNERKLINIYEGKMNGIGAKQTNLSATWFKSALKNDEHKKLKNNLYNYLRRTAKSNSNLSMWSTFNGENDRIKDYYNPPSFTKGCFVACNARATNEFSQKKDLAYLVNIYVHPFVIRFLRERTGLKMDSDRYALSQMIQWIWRSRIRNGGSINLYIPSYRMRRILYNWLGVEYKYIQPDRRKSK